jgi:glycosyltransferase involved in cell wall biosynthesis
LLGLRGFLLAARAKIGESISRYMGRSVMGNAPTAQGGKANSESQFSTEWADASSKRDTDEMSANSAGRSLAVSVIIPVYNAANYIGEALGSVFAQTFKDFEVIVINDGSSDTEQLEEVLRPYRDRIHYLKQPNRGPSGARNTGVRLARGEFVAFLDSDDTWQPAYLAEQLRMFDDDPALEFVYCDAWFVGDTHWAGKRYTDLFPPRSTEVTFEALLRRDCPLVFTPCVVVRRRTLVETGLFDEELRYWEDVHLWLRIAQKRRRMAYQRKALAHRRVRKGSLASARERPEVDRTEIPMLQKLRTEPGLSDDDRATVGRCIELRRANIDLRLGKEALERGDFSRALDLLASANEALNTKKLTLVLAGLRVAPRLTRLGARLWWNLCERTEGELRVLSQMDWVRR